MPTPATWAAAEADRAAHSYTGRASLCGHRTAATTPAPVGPAAPRCPRCVRWSRL